GIILTAEGEKGNTAQVLSSGGNVQSAWEALAEGESVQITGSDRAGNEISVSIVKKAGSTADDFLVEVNNAFNGMADASFDGSGLMVITDKVGGSSQLSISEMTVGAATETVSVTVYGDEGAGVLSIGKDAYFSVENIFMSTGGNSTSGFVAGVTFDFHSVSKGETVTVALDRDHDAIKKKFQEMLDAYNALVRFSKSTTKVADPSDENAKSGDLAGDLTVRNIISQLNNLFHRQFDELNAVYTSFNMIGLKTDITNGELKIDDEMFDKALTERFDEVVNLFITVGTSDNSTIVLGNSSSDTKAGIYLLEEVDGEHFRARRQGDATWYTSAARVGDIVSFEEGPLTGLSLTAPAGSIGAGNSAAFTLSKGLSTLIDEAIENLTKSQEGLIALRTESWQRRISQADDKIMQLEERIEKYRLRLVNQFSAMEQALSALQAQSANMLNAIGSFSYDT
ncbi:MAG: flagellar filament capping protein FliD, partial [Chitinispirillaceae bacterium]|nr:flagellar filament capping protein FliD [Chitinispirillaceae bacterium]